ncbi:MAG: 8-oxo-dGTP diphosphatase [Candidatus Dojkabacteria bacterium]|jgi:8-oxo-dGTP pyrophosphatase MutT (NUDIX family)|nr:8-oxo-dGTP diphosphatase [Candidatus Dojkabacteria bacterium]
MRKATLVFLINKDTNSICLGMKKRGFGALRWNGFGGKVNKGEDIEDAAIREIYEETTDSNQNEGVIIDRKDLERVAILNFTFPHQQDWNQQVHVFFVEKWNGNINESEEMKPEWFDIDEIPYSDMWSDDKYWLPRVLKGERMTADFSFNENDEMISNEIRDFPLK